MSKTGKAKPIESIADLTPDPRNARKHNPRNIKLIQDSLHDVGAARSIVIDENGVILAGNGVTEAANLAGIEKVQVVDADGETLIAVRRSGLTAKQKKKLALADNRATELSEWDTDVLAEIAAQDGDLLDGLFDENELAELIGQGEAQAETADVGELTERADELKEKYGVEAGDIWQCGKHRIICADSTDFEAFKQLTQGKQINVIADPPYNIGFTYDSIDDKMGKPQYAEFCVKWFACWSSNAIGIILTPGPRNERLYQEPRDKGIWVKRNATAGASVFHLRLAEPILFYGKFGGKRNTDVFDYSSGFSEELRAAQRAARVEDKHPPAKALDLWKDLIGMFAGDDVGDPFLGNGTSLIACEMLGKNGYFSELSPAYVAVSLERWAILTGLTPNRLENE